MIPDRRLKMTAEDIENGERRDQWNCAIAETIKRVIPTATRVRVNRKTISWTENDERVRYPTPEAAIEAVIRPLDENKPDVKPEPIELQLRGGVTVPSKHKPEPVLIKRRKDERKYAKQIRQGERPAPPSLKVKSGEEYPTSRTYNRFLDQSRANERGIG